MQHNARRKCCKAELLQVRQRQLVDTEEKQSSPVSIHNFYDNFKHYTRTGDDFDQESAFTTRQGWTLPDHNSQPKYTTQSAANRRQYKHDVQRCSQHHIPILATI